MAGHVRLQVDRIVSLYDCGRWIAVPMGLNAAGEWHDSLPFFTAPDRSREALAIILESAHEQSGPDPDQPEDVYAEDMLSGIEMLWTLSFFTNKSIRLSPQIPVIKSSSEGDFTSFESVQGQFFINPPLLFPKIAEALSQFKLVSPDQVRK